jgi:hypothetical protein
MIKELHAYNQRPCQIIYGIDEFARFRLSTRISLDRNQEKQLILKEFKLIE